MQEGTFGFVQKPFVLLKNKLLYYHSKREKCFLKVIEGTSKEKTSSKKKNKSKYNAAIFQSLRKHVAVWIPLSFTKRALELNLKKTLNESFRLL